MAVELTKAEKEEIYNVRGFFTKDKFLDEKSLVEIESLIGYHHGRLSEGANIFRIIIPEKWHLNEPDFLKQFLTQFELFGYSQVAEQHAYRYKYSHQDASGNTIINENNIIGNPKYDIDVFKKMALESWENEGPNSLIKIQPTTLHDDTILIDDQYPPGSGIPQWKIVYGIKWKAKLVAKLDKYSDIYYSPKGMKK